MKISNKDLIGLRQRGIFTDGQATITPNNIGLPAGLLTALSPQIVENVMNYRTADEVLGGRAKVVDWADTEYILPFIERTGQTTPYGDFAQPKTSGVNTSFNRSGHYLFTAKYLYGDREAEQYSRARIDYATVCLSAATEAIAIELNRSAMEGYILNTSGTYLCYGLLNNPNLGNYEAGIDFSDAATTWQDIMGFFATAVQALVTQTGNNINGQSNIRVAISATAFARLQSIHTDLGVSVYKQIKDTYPGMNFVPAIELDNAHLGENVIYFIGESMAGGLADTTKLGYSEIARMGRVVQGDYSFSQAISAGTVGAIVYKPFMIKRYSGV